MILTVLNTPALPVSAVVKYQLLSELCWEWLLWILVVQPAILSNLHSIQITTSHIVYSYEPPGIIQQSTPGYKYVNFLRSKGWPENWSWFLHYSLLDSFIISSLRVSRSVLSRGYRRLLLPRMDYLCWHCLPPSPGLFSPKFSFPRVAPISVDYTPASLSGLGRPGNQQVYTLSNLSLIIIFISENVNKCTAVQCSTVQYSTVQYSTVQEGVGRPDSIQYKGGLLLVIRL